MKEGQQTKETGQQYNSQTHTNVPTHEHQVHLSPPQFLHTNALFFSPFSFSSPLLSDRKQGMKKKRKELTMNAAVLLRHSESSVSDTTLHHCCTSTTASLSALQTERQSTAAEEDHRVYETHPEKQ